MSSILVGVFDNSSQARNASSKLAAAGIDKASMRLSGGEPGADAGTAPASNPSDDKPGAISRFFSNLFSTDDDAATYTEATRRGHVVLTVTLADEQRADAVSEIMENCGAIDIDARVEQWKAQGYVVQGSLLPDTPDEHPGQRYAGSERRFNSGAGFVGHERRSGL